MGKEGKHTKKLLNTLLKIAPNSQDADRLKGYYDQVKQLKVKSRL